VVLKLDKIVNDISLTRNIEKSIYNSIIEECRVKHIHRSWENVIFKKIYLSKVISIYSNLNKETYIKNCNFLDRIKNKEIKVEDIGKMSSIDIFPEKWKEIMSKKFEQDKKLHEYKPEAMTDIFKCRKCGSRKCSYYELQTRSADEPMTQFITCLKCKARWRQ
jgi:DNA-directed RNA polymerase subunit M/transcription elongation factor TFIIS